ncbi:synoviolin-like, partial [Tropilaelaps mercedesae]
MAAPEVGGQGQPVGRRPAWQALSIGAGGGLADACLSVAMRVPGLFIIDHWWQHERIRALPQTLENTAVMQALLNSVGQGNPKLQTLTLGENAVIMKFIDMHKELNSSAPLCSNFGKLGRGHILVHGFLLLLLPIEHLRILYSHLLSGVLLFASHFISERYVVLEMSREVLRNASPLSEGLLLPETSHTLQRRSTVFDLPLASTASNSRHLATLICQVAISMAVLSFLERPSRSLQVVLCVHTLPVLARLADLPLETLPSLQTFGDALLCLAVLYHLCYKLPSLLDRIKETYTDAITIGHRGIDTMHLLSLLWGRLFVPAHFVVFWALSFCAKAAEGLSSDSAYSSRPLIFILQCMSALCCSPINLLATAVVVSCLSHLVIRGTKWFIGTAHEDNPLRPGWTQGVTMLLLGLQTGLMQVELPGRTLVLLVILFVVMSSLLQSILEITEPVVLSLNASHTLAWRRYVKVLLVCVLLFVLPLLLTFKLATILTIDAWVIMVLSTSVVTSVQAIGIMSVHTLFIYDGLHGRGVDLDDFLYMARALTKTLELLVSLLAVGVGAYDSSTGEWNPANLSILVVHTYCNIYRRIRVGWRSFLLRREASMKTDSLASPTVEQLAAHGDVC